MTNNAKPEALAGKTIAILATDGVERVELTEPRAAIHSSGGRTEILSLEAGEFRTYDGLDPSETLTATKSVADADAADYDGVLLPGGVANGDALRADDDAVAFVSAARAAGTPLAAICHAPWVLIDAGVADGIKLTSYPSLATDLRNAGAEWVDEEVVVDSGVVTSRNPDDIPAFNTSLIELFAGGRAQTPA